MKRVLIAGVSTRAAAESAARAGFEVTALDAFADLDQHPSVRALSLPRDFGIPFTPRNAARAARSIECDAVVYLSSFENAPRAVAALASGRALWGNTPDTLRHVRDPFTLADVLRRRGFPVPALSRHDPDDSNDPTGRWLLKPLASGGGHGIRPWQGGAMPRKRYLQELVCGTPASVVFVAARRGATLLGVSRQLVGEQAFGGSGFRYCGNVMSHPGALDDRLLSSLSAIAEEVVEAFGLVGVNGVDVILRDGVPYPVEVNPRWSASLELIERSSGISVFSLHADACARGVLPSVDFRSGWTARAAASGKAVVFARAEHVVGDTRAWLLDNTVRDVPWPGERIAPGQPICTVFAEGADEADCRAALVQRAARVYAEIG